MPINVPKPARRTESDGCIVNGDGVQSSNGVG